MIQFRRISPNDWKSFKDISDEAFGSPETTKKDFLKTVEEKGFFGCFVEDKLVGYSRMIIMENYSILGRIAVHKSERGKGYGTKIMNFSVDYFRKNNVKEIELYVETKNDIAIALYRKFGFVFANESWHYLIEEDSINDIEKDRIVIENASIGDLTLENYEMITEVFPDINKEELKIHLTSDHTGLHGKSIPLGLFVNNELKVYGRFNPDFPGFKPFLCKELKYVDVFLARLKRYRKKNYIHITFDRNKDLSEFFMKRGYKLRHQMWVMKKDME